MNKLKYTTSSRGLAKLTNNINPNFVTGFFDAGLISNNTTYISIRNLYTTPLILLFTPIFRLNSSKLYLNNKKHLVGFCTSSSNKNLSLVVWGTNLTSQVGTGRFSKQV